MIALLQQIDNIEHTVKTFSAFWWSTSGAIIGITLLLLYATRWIRTDEQKNFYGRIIAYVILVWALILAPAHYLRGAWHVSYGLPLQLCDISAYLVVAALLTRRQRIFEVSYYLGLVGAINALLTPQFTQGTSFFFMLEFYVSHCGLLLGPLYMVKVLGMRPRPLSWLVAFLWLNIIAWTVALINWFVGANYMFMCSPPTADTPFLFTKIWPWYLTGFEIVALVFALVLYAPFWYSARRNDARDVEPATVPVESR